MAETNARPNGGRMRNEEALAIEAQIPALRRYARALMRDPERADDLVQDCLERSVSRFEQFTPGTNLRTWLFTIMHNLYCDEMRRVRRRGPHVPVSEWESSAQTPPTQSSAVEMREFEEAFKRLPERDQQLLMLVAVEGFSYEEVSEVLDVAVGTVKSRLFRARGRLRALQEERRARRDQHDMAELRVAAQA